MQSSSTMESSGLVARAWAWPSLSGTRLGFPGAAVPGPGGGAGAPEVLAVSGGPAAPVGRPSAGTLRAPWPLCFRLMWSLRLAAFLKTFSGQIGQGAPGSLSSCWFWIWLFRLHLYLSTLPQKGHSTALLSVQRASSAGSSQPEWSSLMDSFSLWWSSHSSVYSSSSSSLRVLWRIPLRCSLDSTRLALVGLGRSALPGSGGVLSPGRGVGLRQSEGLR